MYAGIDWASEEHAVCVHDADGQRVASFSIPHSADGLEHLVDRLSRLGDPTELPVAVERPDGRLVDRLLEAGHPLVPVSSNAIKAWREAEVTSGAKSDPGDAETICEYLRLRFHRLRVLHPYSEETRALRAAVRARADLVAQRVAAQNQLEATLDAFWPGAKAVFADVTSKIALAFLQRYPTPASAATLGERRMAAFCARNGYSGRRSPRELVQRLRAAPSGIVDGPESAARQEGRARVCPGPGGSQPSHRRLGLRRRHPPRRAPGRRGLHRCHAPSINAAQMLASRATVAKPTKAPVRIAAGRRHPRHGEMSGSLVGHFRWARKRRFRNSSRPSRTTLAMQPGPPASTRAPSSGA